MDLLWITTIESIDNYEIFFTLAATLSPKTPTVKSLAFCIHILILLLDVDKP